MSFIIDPPLLLFCGLAIYFLGQRLKWSRHAKIVLGLAVALVFIVFSFLLYADIIDCAFPFFSELSGSRFMFHSDITGIEKSEVPKIIVLFLFLLYPHLDFSRLLHTDASEKEEPCLQKGLLLFPGQEQDRGQAREHRTD